MTSLALLLSLLLGDYGNRVSIPQLSEESFKPFIPHITKSFNDKAPESGYVLFDIIEVSVERTIERIEFAGINQYHSDDHYKADLVFVPTTCEGEKVLELSKLGPCRIRNGELLGFTVPDNILESFEEFKQNYGRIYSSNEETGRYLIFRQNYLKAQLYQALEQGTAEYGVTAFSDLSEDEFKQTHLLPGWKPTNELTGTAVPLMDEPLPDEFDWREKGAVTEVKNQGYCGSCWAFSTTGNIEAQWFRKSGNLISLSEQQLVDCDGLDEGCGGGLPSNAYQAIIKMGGLMSEQDYPYDAKRESCHENPDQLKAYINGSVALPKNETLLAMWLAQNSTISVGVNALFMQFYRHGVMHPWHFLCPAAGLDHAVLLVGYGVDNHKPFWIVKNSWGKKWGESGYGRVYRGDGTCGINQVATSAVIF